MRSLFLSRKQTASCLLRPNKSHSGAGRLHKIGELGSSGSLEIGALAIAGYAQASAARQ